MADSSDLIVFDQEYYYAKREIKEYGEALVKLMDDYITKVRFVMDEAINDELITEALQALIDQISPLKEIVEGVTQQVSSDCENFVRGIDAADDFLY